MPEYCPITGSHIVGQVGFISDILPIFRTFDCPVMRSIFDVTDWESCRQRASQIQQRVVNQGNMPPGGLPQAQRALVAEWIRDGTPKFRGTQYSAFFTEVDSYTEYFRFYNAPENYMPAVFVYFDNTMENGPKAINAWWRWVLSRGLPEEQPARAALDALLQDAGVRDAVLRVQGLMERLLLKHFPAEGGGIDFGAFYDATECFARDVLPPDEDRRSRVRNSIPTNASAEDRQQLETYADCYARYHRMDSEPMWFNWAAHADMALMIEGDADGPALAKQAQMAAATCGSVIDFVFRRRGKTRDAYSTNPGKTLVSMRSTSKRLRADLPALRAELYDLVEIFRTPTFDPIA
jgi:hypothetical protein